MSSSASTDTFPARPADVAEVRRAAGITIAPEAALHRALQERTDELERVRAEWHTEALKLRGRIHEVADERDELIRRVDEARAEIAAALREIPIEQHRHHAGKPPIVLRDEVASVVRQKSLRDHEMDRVWDACETVLTPDEVTAIVNAQPDDVEMGSEVLVRAVIAKLRREHSEVRAPACQRGCMLTAPIGNGVRWPAPSDDESTPTAPDVGPTTSAPAAGAADPPRRRTPDEIRAWAAGLFGEGP